MKKIISEFREFAMKGNVVDLAVGVIIGGAFGKIVTSLVSDIIMPLVGLLLGKVSFTDIKIGPVAVGNFIQASVDFIIIALSVFFMVKAMNVFRKKEDIKDQNNGQRI
jgi:large conductance mechanosensitive channel